MSRHNGSQPRSEEMAGIHIGRLLQRVVDLIDLQAELLKVDARDGLKSLLFPSALLGAGIGLGFGSAVIVLFGVARFLSEWAGLSETASLLSVGVFGWFAAACAVIWGSYLMRRAIAAFDRSKMEFRKNFVWLKTVLRQSSRDKRRHERIIQTPR